MNKYITCKHCGARLDLSEIERTIEVKKALEAIFPVIVREVDDVFEIISKFVAVLTTIEGYKEPAHYIARHNQLILDIYDAVFKNKATKE